MRNIPNAKTSLSTLVACGVLSWASPAVAAQLYGQITNPDGSPVAKAKIEIQCSGAQPVKGSTDKLGRYRVSVEQTGTCDIRLPEHGNASGKIVSYKKPARFNFRLANGRLERS